MIVNDSFPRLTTRMIVHDSFWSAVFPKHQWAHLKWKEIRVYIQDDNHDKENTEDQDILEKIHVSSEESVNSQELEETLQKKKRITKCSLLKKGNVARSSNGLILRLIEEYEAWPCLWEAILVFTFLC